MANLPKQFVRASASTTSATLATVGAGKTAIITSISITNPTATGVTATILFNDVEYLSSVTVAANDTMIIDTKTVLAAGETIKGLASSTSVKFHISGVEVG
jgi:hypothetical protein